jgi:salicylate hydroxylase
MTWPLLELAPLPSWTQGRITLLGDAAHPLMPFLASGAIMAIEDAAVLAAALAGADGDVEGAFRAYETSRIPRTRRVQQASARMGEIYHMQGAMRLARNAVLSALPENVLIRRNDWLYGYCAVD